MKYMISVKMREYDLTIMLMLDTFRDTAILLADNSSVINMYMTSGRPVIYCPTDNIVFSKEFNELVKKCRQ